MLCVERHAGSTRRQDESICSSYNILQIVVFLVLLMVRGGLTLVNMFLGFVDMQLRYSTEPHLGYSPTTRDGVPYYCVSRHSPTSQLWSSVKVWHFANCGLLQAQLVMQSTMGGGTSETPGDVSTSIVGRLKSCIKHRGRFLCLATYWRRFETELKPESTISYVCLFA